jgi:T5orf172 domain
MSTNRKRQGKDVKSVQSESKAAEDAGEQFPRTMFGRTTSGSQSGSINRNSPSSDFLGKTESSLALRKFVQSNLKATGAAGTKYPRTRNFNYTAAGSPSASKNRTSPSESFGNTEVFTELRKKTQDDDCSNPFGGAGETKTEATARAQHTNPTVQEYGTSFRGDGTPKSTGSVSTNAIRGRGTSTTEKPDKKKKKAVLTGTAAKPSTSSSPASELVHNVSKSAGYSTLGKSSPLNEAPSALFKGGDSIGLSEKKSQHHDTGTSRPMDSQPKTKVAPRRSPRIASMKATKAEKQGLKHPPGPHLPTPDSAASAQYQLSLSASPSTPTPKMRIQVQNALGGPDSSHPYYSVSSLPDPFTYTPESPSPTSFIKEEGNSASSSSSIKNEPDAGDDTHSSITVLALHRDPYRRSQSAPLIGNPSPGGPDVVWEWSFTKNRQRMLPPVLWTVQTMCKDLTQNEIPKGYIYAISVDDPQMNNYIKIGVTQDLKGRRRQHEKCYGQLREIYPPLGQDSIQVDHAGRVEHLIHAELMQHALELEQCPNPRGSHGAHREWYYVEDSHTIAVIEKWSHWMSSSPYKEGPPIEITKKQCPSERRASGNNVTAKSPKSKSPSPGSKTSKSKSPSPSAETPPSKSPQRPATSPTTRWYLKSIGPVEMMDLCWPLSMCTTAPDGDGTVEVGTKLRRHSIG